MKVIPTWESNVRRDWDAVQKPKASIFAGTVAFIAFFVTWFLAFWLIAVLMAQEIQIYEIVFLWSLFCSLPIAVAVVDVIGPRMRTTIPDPIYKPLRNELAHSQGTIHPGGSSAHHAQNRLPHAVNRLLPLMADIKNNEVKMLAVDIHDRLEWTARHGHSLENYLDHRLLATAVAEDYLPTTLASFTALPHQDDPRAVEYTTTVLTVLGKELVRINSAIDSHRLDTLTAHNESIARLFNGFAGENNE